MAKHKPTFSPSLLWQYVVCKTYVLNICLGLICINTIIEAYLQIHEMYLLLKLNLNKIILIREEVRTMNYSLTLSFAHQQQNMYVSNKIISFYLFAT